MMTLIIGGSGSGKSAYAEDLIIKRSKGKGKYYIATMKNQDQECEKKVRRHQSLREGKGFITIEQEVNIEEVLKKVNIGKKTALLECISNLTANEMFIGNAMVPKEVVIERVIKGIEVLKQEFTQLVVVSNNVFEDGCRYDETTMDYLDAIGKINACLATMAEEVIEVVVGIPIFIK